MKTSVVVLVIGLSVGLTGAGSTDAVGEDFTSQEVIARSIAYHDPQGVWDRGEIHLVLRTTYSDELAQRSGSPEASAQLWLSPAREQFRYTKDVGEDVVEYRLNRGEPYVAVNGSTSISDEDRQRLRVGDPALYRDYFEYLYGMPMKLRDPGTNVESGVRASQFNGRDSWSVRVTYDAGVGEDTWYFYFDKQTFALTGYRFFHDESGNDGEYITFEGEARDAETGMRIPKVRAWFYNKDDKYLATDDIVSLEIQTR